MHETYLKKQNSADSYLCFRLALLYSVSYFFFLYSSLSSSLGIVFDAISSKLDEVFCINTSTNVLAFGDFSVHYKVWLTYSGGTIRPGEICYIFSISSDLTHIPDCDSHSPALLDFFLLTLVFVIHLLSLLWEILIMWLSQFPLTFHQTQNGYLVSSHSL